MSATTLSLRLPVNMTEDEFLSVVKLWIDNSPFYKELSALLKDGITNKTSVTVKETSLEVTKKNTKNDSWIAVKHINRYLEQEWETNLLFREGTDREVVIHITCLGDISHTTSFPYQRLEIIRWFSVTKDFVLYDEIFNGSNHVYAEEKDKDFLVSVINGDTVPVLPVVYVTKFFGSSGYAVDMNALAKRLAGIAYVVCEPDEAYTDSLNNRVKDARHTLPKNGAVGVYFGGNKIIYPKNKFSSVDGYVMQYVLQAVTSHTNKNYMTPFKFNRDVIAEHEALLDEYNAENLSLEEKLKEAETKISALILKNKILEDTVASLKMNVSLSGEQSMLKKSDTSEFFEGEQHDAVLTALEIALRSIGEDTRLCEVITSILACNNKENHGIVIFNEVKKLFSNGQNLNRTEMSRLEDLGFAVVGENTHKKLVFKGNEKYMFPLASTGSDNRRGGLNFAGEITRKLSVY